MQTTHINKKEIVDFFLKKNLLISDDLLGCLENEKNIPEFYKLIKEAGQGDIVVLNKNIKWIAEQKKHLQGQGSSHVGHQSAEQITPDGNVKIIFSYNRTPKKRSASDFIQYFNIRYQSIEKILKQRQELQNTTSINRITNKKDREQVSIICMVEDKQYTKNGNCMLTVEDRTGRIKVLISQNKPDLFKSAKDVVLDDMVGVSGVNGNNIIFANSLLFPDLPTTKETKKTIDEAYALFLSDLHVGSNNFLGEDFDKFLKWINCNLGNETQRQIASKVKYIFIIGDLVDGCGVYPGQEKELTIKDIKDQYKTCAELLGKIPSRIKLIVCPGNHDAMRLAEPQLPVYKDFAEPLYALPNVIMASNPCAVNIHSSNTFSGFDVLVYHGYSFDFYFAEVESLRAMGGYDRADLLMKFLLQKRHLAPSYTSTPYVPDTQSDFLTINKIPDFFVSGHIHKAAAANYRGVTLISGSCWQSKTAFQEKVGHNPEPSRVPIVNLQTRQIKMLKFGK